MMFTTPLSALAPQTAEPGPRVTSICSISEKSSGSRSQATKPKKSWYTERPSIITSCEASSVPVAARALMFTSRALVCVTFRPGTWRSRSA